MQTLLPGAGGDVKTLLALWERGLGHADCARGDALLRVVADDPAPPRTLGERTIRLLRLHTALFGPEIELLSHCPACGTVAQFSSDCHALVQQLPSPDPARPHRLEIHGVSIEFRLPDGGDVAAAAAEETEVGFVRHVLDRCVLACTRDGAGMRAGDLPEAVLDVLSRRMEALDPGANVSFGVTCPQCAAQWNAPLDAGQLVWQKVQASAERLLLEIDVLARAYGWTEPEVLGLSPLRRAAYLQMATV